MATAFDVLVCTHRLDAALRRALASCFEQSLQPRRVVLVVNGLSIGRAEQDWLDGLVRTWPALQVLSTPVRGLVFSLNLGLGACRAPLVARMDADDVALPQRFERQVAWMASHPQTTILGTWYECVDAQGQVTRRMQLPTDDARIRRALFWRNPLCHPSVMYRREAILALGGYQGRTDAEDYDLWLRASRRPGCGFANLPEACLHYSAASTGGARRSRQAYASVLASQARQLATGGGLLWAPAMLWTCAKLLLRSA